MCVCYEATGSSDSYLPRVRDSDLGDELEVDRGSTREDQKIALLLFW